MGRFPSACLKTAFLLACSGCHAAAPTGAATAADAGADTSPAASADSADTVQTTDAVPAATVDSAPGPAPSGLTVHEWATFSVFHAVVPAQHIAGVGRAEEQLPPFVHKMAPASRTPSGMAAGPALAKLQTAGAFWGATSAGDVRFEVTLPQGVVVADWPSADEAKPAAGQAAWLLHVDPSLSPAKVPPPVAPDSLWHGLRQAGGAQVHSRTKPQELDTHVFYQAVGSFAPPMRISAAKAAFGSGYSGVVSNDGDTAVPQAWLLHLHSGGALLQRLHSVPAKSDTPFSRSPKEAPLDFYAKVKLDLTSALQAEGLTEGESAALVATFTHNWLKTYGLRVVVVAPAAWAQTVWQTNVSPPAVAHKRVMLGRFELLTAESEAEMLQQIQAAAGTADFGVLDTLGFFAEPKARRAGQISQDPGVSAFVAKLVAAAEKLP